VTAPAAEPLSHFARIAPVLGLLVLFVIVGAVALLLIKRWWKREGDSPAGFTLGDLRAMRDSGEISVAEYERAKEQMVRKVRSQPASSKAVKGPRGTTR
jgi:hypothetical protein